MKKIIISGIFITAFAIVATIFYNNVNKTELSDLAKANIEALAGEDKEEKPLEEATITCNTGGEGQCWVCDESYDENDIYHCKCHFSGYQADYCKC